MGLKTGVQAPLMGLDALRKSVDWWSRIKELWSLILECPFCEWSKIGITDPASLHHLEQEHGRPNMSELLQVNIHIAGGEGGQVLLRFVRQWVRCLHLLLFKWSLQSYPPGSRGGLEKGGRAFSGHWSLSLECVDGLADWAQPHKLWGFSAKWHFAQLWADPSVWVCLSLPRALFLWGVERHLLWWQADSSLQVLFPPCPVELAKLIKTGCVGFLCALFGFQETWNCWPETWRCCCPLSHQAWPSGPRRILHLDLCQCGQVPDGPLSEREAAASVQVVCHELRGRAEEN